MRGTWFLAAAAAVLLAVAAGALSLLRQRARPAAAAHPASRPSAPAAFHGSEINLTGKIRAQQVIAIAAPMQGTVEALLVEPGQPVYEGQLLGKIKNATLESAQQDAQAALERAQARLSRAETEMIGARLDASRARADAARVQTEYDRAEREYLRQQTLLNAGATPRLVYQKYAAEYESLKTQRDSATELARAAESRLAELVKSVDAGRKALDDRTQALDEAQQNAASAEIQSPVSGVLVGRSRQQGDEVTPDVADLFQIAVNVSALEAVVEPEPAALARVHVGQPAVLTVAEAPDAIQGKVKEVQGTQVVVEFTSPSPAVRPGMTAQVRIPLN